MVAWSSVTLISPMFILKRYSHSVLEISRRCLIPAAVRIRNSSRPGPLDHALNDVASLNDGPVRMQENIGARDRFRPFHIVVPGESETQRNTGIAVNARHIAGAGYESVLRSDRCAQISRRARSPL